MNERWEYLSVSWVYSSEKLAEKTPTGRSKFAFAQHLYVWRSGATEAEVHPLWSSTDPEVSGNFLDIFNSLGAEGWELASDLVVDNVVGPKEAWSEVGYPIRQRWLFKRRV